MSNHLLHAPLPSGSLLEIAPAKVELARIDDENGGYAIVASDGDLTIRIVVDAESYVKLIRTAHDQLDADGAPSGKIHAVKSLPPELKHAGGILGHRANGT